MNNSKIAIIGSGLVGSSVAFSAALLRQCAEIAIIDVNREKAEGEAMDISHGLAFMGQMKLYAGDYSDCADANVIVVTAGLKRKPGDTRLDLAKNNAVVIKEITQSIMKYYKGGLILVVSNPVDVMTYYIYKWSGLPAKKVFGTGTVLDSARFKYLLSEKLSIDVRNVHGHVIGEHGDSQIPVWSSANVAGVNLDEYCRIRHSESAVDKQAISDNVKKSGSSIIQKKGATYYAIAATVNRVLEAVFKNQNSVLTLSSVLDGQYGLKDVALGLPCVINEEGIEAILDIHLEPDELAGFKNSAVEVKKVIEELKDV